MSKWTESIKKSKQFNSKGSELSPADQAKRIQELETMLLGQIIELVMHKEPVEPGLYRGFGVFKSKNPDNAGARRWPVYFTDDDLSIYNETESFEAMLKLRVCNNLATHMVITIDWLQEVVNG